MTITSLNTCKCGHARQEHQDEDAKCLGADWWGYPDGLIWCDCEGFTPADDAQRAANSAPTSDPA